MGAVMERCRVERWATNTMVTDDPFKLNAKAGSLFGLVVPVTILHVCACDRINVSILGDSGRHTGDLTIQLPVVGRSVMRRCDPPLMALSLYDSAASGGRTSQQPGPCPEARQWCRRRLLRAESVVCQIPIPCDRRWRRWIEGLVTGSIVTGNLWLRDTAEGPWVVLADQLVHRGYAEVRA